MGVVCPVNALAAVRRGTHERNTRERQGWMGDGFREEAQD